MSLALKITNWDRNILKDILTLIDFLLDCFGAWKDLGDACAKRPTKKFQVREEPAKTYSTVGKNLMESGFSTSQDETSSSETGQARVLAPLVLS
jgi:hypothetical protein